MRTYVEILIILPLLVICFQLYLFSAHIAGRKQQERSRKLGIAYMTLGIMALVFKSAPLAFFGLILMMFAFRLIARGLDRLDKNVFIDQCVDDK